METENRLAQRREFKALRDRYRAAAGRLYGVKVSSVAWVQTMDDGAFVEIQVWIPKEETDHHELHDVPMEELMPRIESGE